MKKFVIKKAVIEKSDKEINLGIGYQFDSGLNLICGDNETGKTSLMNFIKTSLLTKNNGDTGSVFINVSGDDYVIQMNNSNSKNVIYSLSENTKIDSNFIKQNIPQKELEHVFSINLDDLMIIEKEDTKTLINLMKDSSCEYLNEYIEEIENKLSQSWGKTNVVKNLAKLKNEILLLNKEIKEKSNKEKTYNELIVKLNDLNEELTYLKVEQSNFENEKKISEYIEKIKVLENEYNSLSVNYNSNLVDKNAEYIKFTESLISYNSNLKAIKENEENIEKLNSKIFFSINKLKKEFAVELTEKEMVEFSIDSSKTKKVAQSLDEMKAIISNLSALFIERNSFENNIKNVDEKIQALSHKYKFSNSLGELEEFHKYIETSLKYYSHLQNEIDGNIKQNIISEIKSSKIFLVISSFVLILALILTVLCFYNKMNLLGPISASVFILVGIINVLIYKSGFSPKLKEHKLAKEKILNDLNKKIKELNPEFCETNQALLLLQINDLKQEIYNKKEQLSEKIQDKNDYVQKLVVVNSSISDLERRKREIEDENERIIKSDFIIELSGNEYLQVIDIIDAVKIVVEEKQKLLNENEQYLIINNDIQKELKNFVLENKIEIPFDYEYEQKIEQLKAYYLSNSTLGKSLESLKIKIDSLNEQKNELEEKMVLFNSDKKFLSQVELDFELSLKNKQKEELLGKKSAIEQSESLENLKIKRNILQQKYDNELASLLKKKIILALCEKAKMNFDKKQPNLQKAQEFLSVMTDGKYTKINLENELIQDDDSTKIKEWDNLSRGTKELLFFSLKLGFAYNYSKDKITQEPNGKWNLPLIIDDAFVNFDSTRIRNAIKCLVEFSKTNQVLLFTCHTEVMKKYLEELCEDFNIVNL